MSFSEQLGNIWWQVYHFKTPGYFVLRGDQIRKTSFGRCFVGFPNCIYNFRDWMYRVGQSREIYSNSVPLSPPHWPYPKRIRPPSWPRHRVIDPKHQIVYLAHVTRCRCCSEMRLSGAEPVWIQTAARRSHKVTFDMLRRMANPLSLRNWWLHEYDNKDDYALFQV